MLKRNAMWCGFSLYIMNILLVKYHLNKVQIGKLNISENFILEWIFGYYSQMRVVSHWTSLIASNNDNGGLLQDGWLSWDQLYQSADQAHTPIKTHKDEVNNLHSQ